jgi:hypothetical protein
VRLCIAARHALHQRRPSHHYDAPATLYHPGSQIRSAAAQITGPDLPICYGGRRIKSRSTTRCRSIYQRGRVWWFKYYDHRGRARRESSRSTLKSGEAVTRTTRRSRHGQAAKDRVCTFEDLSRLIGDGWGRLRNQRKTWPGASGDWP